MVTLVTLGCFLSRVTKVTKVNGGLILALSFYWLFFDRVTKVTYRRLTFPLEF